MLKIHEALGFKIKQHRKAKNLSTSDLANKLEVSTGLVNNLENGRNDVFKLELLYRLTKELDMRLSDIFDFTPVSISQLNISTGNIAMLVGIKHMVDSENLSVINSHINQIIHSYLSCIGNHGCDIEVIEYIGNHIIYELEFIGKLKAIEAKSPCF